MIDLKTRLDKAFKKLDIPKRNEEQFLKYLNTLIEWNKHIALVSKREENIVNHLLAPSLLFFKIFKDQQLRVIDIGSGAGFPAIPLKIYNSTLDITMIESNSKKTGFLNYVCGKLNLKCRIINQRLEEIKEKLTCNVVTARAINVEKILPVIKEKIKGGYLFYITSKDNHLDLPLEQELLFKKHCAKLYRLTEQVG